MVAEARSRLEPARVRDSLVVALALASGAVDAISWLGLGKVFSAFMTGNLVFVGLRIGGAAEPSVIRVLASLAAFGVGSALGARIVRRGSQPGVVWPGRVTAALAGTVVVQAAFLALWAAVGGRPSRDTAHVLIAVSALAMGIQATAVFALGVRVVFATAATGTFAVLMGDLVGWPQPPMERQRLLATLAALVIGAVIGTVLVLHARAWAAAFPVSISALVVAAAAQAFPR